MPPEGGGYSGPREGGGESAVRAQKVDIKNILPIDLYECTTFAGYIHADLMNSRTRAEPRHVKEFFRMFWGIYNYVRQKMDPDLQEDIDKWFELMYRNSKNVQLLIIGINLFLKMKDEILSWGIGTLFEKPPDPLHFMDILTEIDDELFTRDERDVAPIVRPSET